MSAELIATLSAFLTLGIGVAGGLAWSVRHTDRSIELSDARATERFRLVDDRLDRIDARIDGRTHEVTEVKIAVARHEGPPPVC